MIWTIAWKNIWRNKVRSFVVIIAVFFGVIGGIFSSAVMNGAAVQRVKTAIDNETSNIRITDSLFEENYDIKLFIKNDSQLISKITKLPEVEAVTGRLHLQAMIATASSNGGVYVLGVNPDEDKKVFMLYKYICDSCGSFFRTNKKNQIVVGDKLAEKLNLKLKSKAIITCQDVDGNIVSDVFKVVGIFHSVNSVQNETCVFVEKNTLSQLIQIPSNVSHEIYVRLKPKANQTKADDEVSKIAKEYDVKNWKKIDPTVGMIDDYMDIWMYLFMGIILLALGFGIVNTMMMVVLERVRELGMLKAIGMTKKRIFKMVMLETIFLSLIGGIAGMIFSEGLILWTNHTGINLSFLAQGLETMGYASFIYPEIENSFFFGVTILVIITGIVASILPALRATRLNPADAIRID